MGAALAVAVVLSAAAVAGIVAVLMRLRALGAPALAAQLDSVAHDLDDKFMRATADMADRIASAKGDLLRDGFGAISSELQKQLAAGRREQADALAKEIDSLARRTTENLDRIRGEVDAKLGAISDRVQEKLDQNIRDGFKQFEKVQEHLRNAEEQLRSVGAIGESINDLNHLLRMPHLRGKFGEASLERLLEDFLPAHMYALQASPTGNGSSRADAVIKFPGRTLPIDAKFPREQVLPLFDTGDPQALAAARVELERVIKEQARRIACYIEPENGTTDMALMFLPSETLYMEVVLNGELSEALNRQHVFAVSPNTLIVTLQSIQMVFKMYEFAKSYEKATEELKKAQAAFSYFEDRFDEIGRSLGKAQQAYDVARGHLSRYRARVTGLTGEAPPELDAPLTSRNGGE
jgi:DNA recombination protein RmuC